MSDKRTGRLHRSVVGFCVIVNSLAKTTQVSKEVRDLASAVAKAMVVAEPMAKLNRSLAALRREHGNFFAQVRDWLLQPDIHAQFVRKGHSPTWHRWVTASVQVQKGKLPTQALGMGKAGRPRTNRFSVYMDAALYAEYLTRLQGMANKQATARALNLGAQTLDRSRLQKCRACVCAIKPSTMDLQEQYVAIARKYRLE